MNETNFCIVGLGLIGGSYAQALSKAGKRVTAIDINADSIRYAQENGSIACGADKDFAPLLREADAVVFALYPHTFVEFVREWQSALKPGALITDVSGVKAGVVQPVQAFLREDVEFIACHPMAGREVSGVQYANAAIFENANFIITPTEKNTPRGIGFAKALAAVLGFARVSVLSCEEHDEMIGYVSQLTHAIAVSLMNASDNAHLAQYTGDSFRDLTRIARINEVMWSELFLMNRDNLTEEIDRFCDAMQTLKACLAAGDEAALQQLFITSSKRRAAFDDK
jgi:prephenate dehydrogenase